MKDFETTILILSTLSFIYYIAIQPDYKPDTATGKPKLFGRNDAGIKVKGGKPSEHARSV
jgi:hypothetical protein